MSSKEECEIALENAVDTGIIKKDWKVLNQLIDEHFNGIDNLNEVIEVQKNNLTDSYMIGLYNGLVTAKAILLNNNDNIKLADNTTHPYKFEDLKENMWVWDSDKNRINKITKTFDYDFGIPYIKFDDGFGEIFIEEFEENRFYPVEKANEVQL